MTRRCWTDSFAQHHRSAFANGKYVRVWRGQGHSFTIGWVKYTAMYRQRLCEMPSSDLVKEGCGHLSLVEFRTRYFIDFPPDTECWVLEFLYFPCKE
jgi:hypothetical protein